MLYWSSQQTVAVNCWQLLGLVPGLLFSLGRAALLPSLPGGNTALVVRCLGRTARTAAAVVCSVLGFISLVPALFWTFIYKFFTSLDVQEAMLENMKSDVAT